MKVIPISPTNCIYCNGSAVIGCTACDIDKWKVVGTTPFYSVVKSKAESKD